MLSDNDPPVKKQMFSLLEYIYRNTNRFSGLCPPECSLCERKESLLLLLYEEDFIRAKLRGQRGAPEKKGLFRHDNLGFGHEPSGSPCRVLGEDVRQCTIYQFRPLDCRSFPIVPSFNLGGGGIELFVATYCPIHSHLPEGFAETAKESWSLVEPLLPLPWKRRFNEVNASRTLLPLHCHRTYHTGRGF